MRELQDYFCTYEQREELNKLGLNEEEHEVVCEYYVSKGIPFAGILRSQALDFFRDLGYKFTIHQNEKGHWYELEKDGITRTQGKWHTYSVSENELISRLIELEKEARNGK